MVVMLIIIQQLIQHVVTLTDGTNVTVTLVQSAAKKDASIKKKVKANQYATPVDATEVCIMTHLFISH